MQNRIAFCGAIEGSVIVRDGETEHEAIMRAERAILAVLEKHCKRLGPDGTEYGPVIGLEQKIEWVPA